MAYATSGKKNSDSSSLQARIVLLILDGFGIRKEKLGNAVKLAKMPFYNCLLKKYPHSSLKAGGESDGLLKGTMGNSEVGHLNIGAGRIVYQNDTRISNSIKKGDFFRNKAFAEAVRHAKKKKGEIHLIGLLSDAGVHSRMRHIIALLNIAAENGIAARVHAITDGRDTPPREALRYVRQLEKELGNKGSIATVSGRYFAMDRDKRWERTKKAFEAFANGKGNIRKSAREAILESYKSGKSDEFIEPCIIEGHDGIKKEDSVIAFNFRPDRMRQICGLIEHEKIKLTTMTQYERKLKAPIAFPPAKVKNLLGEVLARNSIRQLRIAETEKYAHVTYFFNGQVEKPMRHEDRKLVQSNRNVATYDLAPEMMAPEIAAEAIRGMKAGKHAAIIANFANPDMIGHTGKIRAAVKALQAIDKSLQAIIEARKDETIIITSDHGNCEEMEGRNKTSHTLNPVPFIIVSDKKIKLRNGIHADIAPTILELLGIGKPDEMTGKSLIMGAEKKKR